MSYELNKKIRELEPYEPISGTYKIRLDANECPENYPDFIKEEIKMQLIQLISTAILIRLRKRLLRLLRIITESIQNM